LICNMGSRSNEYALVCDVCGRTKSGFESFMDAVDFKANPRSRWRSVRRRSGEWNDVCPGCDTPAMAARLRNE
jgi:hypothetical protein